LVTREHQDHCMSSEPQERESSPTLWCGKRMLKDTQGEGGPRSALWGRRGWFPLPRVFCVLGVVRQEWFCLEGQAVQGLSSGEGVNQRCRMKNYVTSIAF
jgi:hypothetical protein